jgi:Na+/phosphate symporter
VLDAEPRQAAYRDTVLLVHPREVVLLVMSLAYSHFITPVAALALILGANLGSAINPLVEGSRGDNPASRRQPPPAAGQPPQSPGGVRARASVSASNRRRTRSHRAQSLAHGRCFHTAFNVSLALVFILPLDALASLLTRLLPERVKPSDPSTPLYLDESALGTSAGSFLSHVRLLPSPGTLQKRRDFFISASSVAASPRRSPVVRGRW